MQLVDLGVGKVVMLAPDDYNLELPDYGGIMMCKEEEQYMPYIFIFGAEQVPEQEFSFDTELALFKKQANDYDTFIEEIADKYYYKDSYEMENMYVYEYYVLFMDVRFVIQLVLNLDQIGTDIEQHYLDEVNKIIETVGFMYEEHHVCLPLTEDESVYIEESIGEILGTDREGVERAIVSGKALDALQWIFDKESLVFKSSQYITKLGLVLGALMRYYYLDFNWVVIEEEGERELALQYKETKEVVFPISLVSSRIEEGEAIRIPRLLDNVYYSVEVKLKNTEDKDKL